MKRIKLPLFVVTLLLLSILSACGSDDIKHEKSAHWDVSLQRSTGSFNIVYIGDETVIKDVICDITGTNIEYQGKANGEHQLPFQMSGPVISNADQNKDPITVRIRWNDQSESIILK